MLKIISQSGDPGKEMYAYLSFGDDPRNKFFMRTYAYDSLKENWHVWGESPLDEIRRSRMFVNDKQLPIGVLNSVPENGGHPMSVLLGALLNGGTCNTMIEVLLGQLPRK